MNNPNYHGCSNCEFQISPFRQCEWAESGGDGKIIRFNGCPRWSERGSEQSGQLQEISYKLTKQEIIDRFRSNAEFERQKGNLNGCLEFKQIAEWLDQLQEIERIVKKEGFIHNPYMAVDMILGIDYILRREQGSR